MVSECSLWRLLQEGRACHSDEYAVTRPKDVQPNEASLCKTQQEVANLLLNILESRSVSAIALTVTRARCISLTACRRIVKCLAFTFEYH
jgi:hypothetical protein